MTEVSITALGDEPPAVVPTGDAPDVEVGTAGIYIGGSPASHETILLAATTTLPADHTVLTIRATAPSLVDVEDAPDGTVVTVHVAEGWQHITWASGITVTGETDTTETWVVLVRAEGAWQALVSASSGGGGEQDSGDVTLAHNEATVHMSELTLRRIGALVSLTGWAYLNASAGTEPIIAHIPSGYLPVGQVRVNPHDPTADAWQAISSGNLQVARGDGAPWADWAETNVSMLWMTGDPWPAP